MTSASISPPRASSCPPNSLCPAFASSGKRPRSWIIEPRVARLRRTVLDGSSSHRSAWIVDARAGRVCFTTSAPLATPRSSCLEPHRRPGDRFRIRRLGMVTFYLSPHVSLWHHPHFLAEGDQLPRQMVGEARATIPARRRSSTSKKLCNPLRRNCRRNTKPPSAVVPWT